MCRDSLQEEARGSPRHAQPWHLHTLKSLRMLGDGHWLPWHGQGSPLQTAGARVGCSGTGTRAGEGAHMAVMVSLWKVTKAMPRGFSFTFSFSRL